VRLDHLLSKELHYPAFGDTTSPVWGRGRSPCRWEFPRRALVIRHPEDDPTPASRSLEPERSPRRHHRVPYVRHHYSVLRESHRPCSTHLRGALRRSGSRPSHEPGASARSWWPSRRPASQSTLENCIASTSIKVLPSYEEPTVDALAPDADEGRGWLRKATVSRLTGFDPWISEWGNPAGVMPSHPRLNT
jgi:hypothetical protein